MYNNENNYECQFDANGHCTVIIVKLAKQDELYRTYKTCLIGQLTKPIRIKRKLQVTQRLI